MWSNFVNESEKPPKISKRPTFGLRNSYSCRISLIFPNSSQNDGDTWLIKGDICDRENGGFALLIFLFAYSWTDFVACAGGADL